MIVRFLADEDIDADLVHALRSREPAIDILDVKTAGLREANDAALLELASEQGRIVITYDRNTMVRHFRERLQAGLPCSGLVILPQQSAAIGVIVESLLIVWAASQAQEWRNQIAYLPFR